MGALWLITTSKRSPPCTWCSASVVASEFIWSLASCGASSVVSVTTENLVPRQFVSSTCLCLMVSVMNKWTWITVLLSKQNLIIQWLSIMCLLPSSLSVLLVVCQSHVFLGLLIQFGINSCVHIVLVRCFAVCFCDRCERVPEYCPYLQFV
jgi:hypothetical protein